MLLMDTRAIYALADRKDSWHSRVRDYLEQQSALLMTPVTVLPEVTYLLRQRLGVSAEHAFVESIAAEELIVEPLEAADFGRASELLTTYPQIGFVDATVAAVAERLRLSSIVTTDRRHFSVLRPRHVAAFELLP